VSVVWHDLECGSYGEDLALWRSLASEQDDPILEVGAGTGRVAIDLARHGHRITALDSDPELLAELEHRAAGLPLETVLADARSFELPQSFGLCVVPMQTIQLFGGHAQRAAFLYCARAHLDPDGLLAIAITSQLEPYETREGIPAPVPDMCERDGIVYASQPVAVRAAERGFVLERRRETIDLAGRRSVQRSTITLDPLDCRRLEREAVAVGLIPAGRCTVPATVEYAGSEVVMLRA